MSLVGCTVFYELEWLEHLETEGRWCTRTTSSTRIEHPTGQNLTNLSLPSLKGHAFVTYFVCDNKLDSAFRHRVVTQSEYWISYNVTNMYSHIKHYDVIICACLYCL